MKNSKLNFLVTFSRPELVQNTATFFFPSSPNKGRKLYTQEQSPKGAFEIKKVFGGKPRSPTSKDRFNSFYEFQNSIRKESVRSLNCSDLGQEQQETSMYYVQTQLKQKSSELKHRVPVQQIKMQISQNSSRPKLPQVNKEFRISNSPCEAQKQNPSKIGSALNFADNIRVKNLRDNIEKQIQLKKQKTLNQFSSDQSTSTSKTKLKDLQQIVNIQNAKLFQKNKVNNWADFGMFSDQQNSNETNQIEQNTFSNKRFNYVVDAEEKKSSTRKLFFRGREQSPTENSKAGKSFLQKKQQMAILDKLFARNSSK